LAGVDLYWNETKLATLTEAPYRYDLTLPKPSDERVLPEVRASAKRRCSRVANFVVDAANFADQVANFADQVANFADQVANFGDRQRISLIE